ncbi:putative mitochondrial protein [Lyophyllum shimeji]|uniref:Mitochondrial protein n=1 Tax=Lyophyllum shimeji TaxID=47721 RepID=A0A9P3PV21_LYOSH|nr:putative mitochondrial protein [Lyophyllum shimeji]
MSESAYKIDALQGEEDYGIWKVKMADILTDAGLLEFVEGTIKPPNEDDPSYSTWLSKDRRALTAIRMRVGKGPFAYVRGAKRSKDAWEALENVYEVQGALGVVLLRRRFYGARCEEGADIEEHIRTLRGWQEELASLGKAMSEEDFSYAILTSLPDSWDSFIRGIDTTSLDNSHRLIARILEEDRRLRNRNGDTALAAKYNPNVSCYNCGKKGHVASNCKKQKNGGGSGGNGKTDDGKSEGNSRRRRGRGGKGTKEGKDSSKSDQAHQVTDDYAFPAIDDAPKDVALAALTNTAILADCAASSHFFRDRAHFTSYVATPGHEVKGLGKAPGVGRGTVVLISKVGDREIPITLKDAVHAPAMPYNLVSLGRTTNGSLDVVLRGNELRVIDTKKKIVIMRGLKTAEHLYRLDARVGAPAAPDIALTVRSARTWEDWHRIFGHMAMKSVKLLKSKEMVVGMNVKGRFSESATCEACIKAKHHVRSLPDKSETVYSEIGEMTFADLWGPARTTGIKGERYLAGFTDGHMRRTVVSFLKKKTDEETCAAIDKYRAHVKNQTGKDLKVIRFDNGREFVNELIREYCDKHGIKIEVTAPYSSSQNGVAERVNRTLLEHARAMLLQHDIQAFLWPEAVAYAAYLKNRSPTRALTDKTPEEIFTGKKPDVSKLQEFGRKCWVLDERGVIGKLDLKSRQFIFTGLSDESRAWRYFNPGARRIQTSRNVIFPADITDQNESISGGIDPLTLEGESDTREQPTGQEQPENQAQPQSTETPQQPSSATTSETTTKTPPSRIPIRSTRLATLTPVNYRLLNNPAARGPREWQHHVPDTSPGDSGNLAIDEVPDFAFLAHDHEEPTSVAEALASDVWRKSMEAELDQLKRLGTFEVVDLPPDRAPIKSKWVWRVKRDGNGKFLKAKSRLVAKGFTQQPGVDYSETFAPVVRMDSLRLLLALAAAYKLKIHVVDIVGVYLNSTLQEEIYLAQPPGLGDGTKRVWRLLKTIYGLKQSGREWNKLLDSLFKSLGYARLVSDQCIYIRGTGESTVVVAVHVDDMTILALTDKLMQQVKHEISQRFGITDLGEANQIVGLHITRKPNGDIKLSQESYLSKIIQKMGLDNANPVHTPMDINVRLQKHDAEDPVDLQLRHEYQVAIGMLMWAAIATRPDIAFAVQHLSQFSQHPAHEHFTAVKRVFRYLKGTIDVGLNYSGTAFDREKIFRVFSDADWGNSPDDRRSISGYVCVASGGPVTWSSKKQPTVALSSMEAEYMALCHATREIIWLRSLVNELGLLGNQPTDLITDNQSAIKFADNPVFHARSKHIDIRHHFVRERIISNEIQIYHCVSADNKADILTKPLARPTHDAKMESLGMAPNLRGSVGRT